MSLVPYNAEGSFLRKTGLATPGISFQYYLLNSQLTLAKLTEADV